ncbi:putative nuclease HARBI1 [Heptranchias perlo]|uniref:putative nuclease HARBI1 n=1 Tax=Heptranchias perlo TaxID=212740 RepID=UPI00355973F6
MRGSSQEDRREQKHLGEEGGGGHYTEDHIHSGSEEQCLKCLHSTKEAVNELCHLLQPQLEPRTRAWTSVPVAVKVTVALNFYATGSFQAASVDISDISQFAVHHCNRKVTEAPYTMRNNYISFPMDRVKQVERALGFACITGFLRVQGTIDCTHIALRTSHRHPGIFLNRKGFHSLNIHLVCDHRHRVMQVCARYPGSSHDLFILHQPSVLPLFQPGHQVTGWLLGDKGYPLSWIMTPVKNPDMAAELAYNEGCAATRNIIEQTVGVLKQCFRCLDLSGGALQYSLEQVFRFVVICCMLHNFATMRDGLYHHLGSKKCSSPSRQQETPEQEDTSEEDSTPGEAVLCSLSLPGTSSDIGTQHGIDSELEWSVPSTSGQQQLLMAGTIHERICRRARSSPSSC